MRTLKALSIALCLCGVCFAGSFMQDAMNNTKKTALNKCEPDANKLCKGVQADRVVACLKGQPEKLSGDCKSQLTTPSNLVPKIH